MATDRGAGERARDAGLVRGIGVLAFAAAIANEVVGSGIYRLPAAMAKTAGTAAPLAYLFCIAAMGAIVLCFAEAGSRVPTSGGPYGYVEAAFGPLAGFVAGVLVWLSSVLACGGIAAAVADVAANAVPALGGAVPHALFITAVLAGISWINLVGVEAASRIIGWTTLAKLLPLFLFLVVGGIALAGGHRAVAPVGHPPAEGFGRAVILAMFALAGMETPLAASGEVRDPARTVPSALLLAMGLIGVGYVLVQLVADGLLGAGLAGSTAPLADALAVAGPGWRAPMLAGAFFSMLAWLGSDLLGAPRVLFAFARDGFLPERLGRLHPRWKTPHVAILVHAMIALALALTGGFEQLAVLSELAIAPLYAGVCLTAVAMRRRGIAGPGHALAVPLLPLLAVVGVGSMGVLVSLARPAEIAGLAAVLASSLLFYAGVRAVRR